MQPNYLPLVKIFGAERHVVPLFQRPYVWQKEENWEPLWQDFSDLCDRVLAAPNEPVRGHFLGTLVLEQIPHKSGGVSTREIVDGQQRLTTLQILCQAVRHALQQVEVAAANAGDEPGTKAARLAAARIGAMTRNPDFSEEDEQYKVWPTNEDRQPFRQVMDAARPADLMGVETRMAHAYRFFLDGVRPWLAAGAAEERSNAIGAFRLAALYQFGGYDQGNGSNGAIDMQVGGDFGGFSFDAIGSKVKDSVSLSSFGESPLQSGVSVNDLKATLSDNTSGVIMLRYAYVALKLYGGFEYILFRNPTDAYPQGFRELLTCALWAPWGNLLPSGIALQRQKQIGLG